jgi:hypothetical protein
LTHCPGCCGLGKGRCQKNKNIVCVREEKEEISKGTGQPLHAEIDSILKWHGIDRAAQFDGYLVGNGCCRLMAEATSIVNEI